MGMGGCEWGGDCVDVGDYLWDVVLAVFLLGVGLGWVHCDQMRDIVYVHGLAIPDTGLTPNIHPITNLHNNLLLHPKPPIILPLLALLAPLPIPIIIIRIQLN